MNLVKPSESSTPLSSACVTRRRRTLIQWQSFCILLLSIALIQVALYARAEKQTADLWRMARAEKERTPLETVANSVPQDSGYYGATLIGKDGSRTTLDGKALEVDLGGKRLLEVMLARQEKNRLDIWAPAKRGDDYFHRVIFRPGCANAFELELERVSLKTESESVRYDAER